MVCCGLSANSKRSFPQLGILIFLRGNSKAGYWPIVNHQTRFVVLESLSLLMAYFIPYGSTACCDGGV